MKHSSLNIQPIAQSLYQLKYPLIQIHFCSIARICVYNIQITTITKNARLPAKIDLENMYEVCSNSIRIGIVVVVYWVGCVCIQSWHIRTYLSNSWHKLQVAAFAQLAVVGRGSNMCVYVIVIFMMCESTKQRICIKFCFKIRKTAM